MINAIRVRAREFWVLTLEDKVSCLINLHINTKNKASIKSKSHFDVGLVNSASWLEHFNCIPKRAKICIALPPEQFQFEHYLLDKSLTNKDSQLFIRQRIKKAYANRQHQSEPVTQVTSLESESGQYNTYQSVTLSHHQLDSIKQWLVKANCQCLRLESQQSILMWLKGVQFEPSELPWGVLTYSDHKLSLILVKGPLILCQKTIAQDKADLAVLIQRLQQLITLCDLDQLPCLYLCPELYQGLEGVSLNNAKLRVFKPLTEHKQITDLEFVCIAYAIKQSILG